MRTALYFFAEFSDQDVDWLAGAGETERVRANQVLVQQGVPIESLYLILSGKFVVTIGDNNVVRTMQQGEVVGEISFVDSRPPTATVTAGEDSTVLAIPRSRLHDKLEMDVEFANRFHRSLCVMHAHRDRDDALRKSKKPGTEADDEFGEQPGDFDPMFFRKLSLAATRLNSLLERVGG